MKIANQIRFFKESLPESITLVAVSKTKPLAAINEAYESGQRDFGENKIQEMVQKWEALPEDIRWHMIGHVQRNKVKYMAPFVHLIHGVDSEKLLLEIEKQAAKNNRTINCLLQVHIAEESTKFGFSPEEVKQVLEKHKTLPHVAIRGLMGMATFTENKDQITREFSQLKELFDELFANHKNAILSMGMSGDYPLALNQGSTLIRVGSKIFGTRNY
ncbi:MAG: YggS family pyridoxal phosphate-dependent enzyme [Flavobacteriaceae bacterium]